MCGIAGFRLRQGVADPGKLRAMCDQIRHRGPDDEGFHIDRGCAIGVRRLSIIDVSTGHQPIANEEQSVWVVFNGEIYNHQQLRGELAALGHTFSTRSDTETLVHLYEQEGVEGIARLRGMFAFAIWDARRQRILLARDRFGKKPLYYALLPEGIFFSSEIRCLRLAGVPLELDREALRLYFQFSYIPEPWTAFRAIRKLEPGSWLSYEADGSIRSERFWRIPTPWDSAPPELSEEEICFRLREVFDESVAARMTADVPLGAFLSGGVDSSSVVASMARQSSAPVQTFSIGFTEAAFDEREYAGLVARKYRTDHHEILVQPDAVSLVSHVVRHFDEPFGDSSALPTFVLAQFAAGHVKVALSGDGGDELFGGYDSFLAVQRLRALDQVPQRVRRFLSWVADRLPYAAYGKNYLRMVSRPSALERYFENNYSPYFLRRQLLEPEWMLPADGAFLAREFAHCLLPGEADILSQAMYFETAANLPGDMLVKVDRMSMANSLEVRCPFLDHTLAELAAQIPQDWKIRNGAGKHIFLRALGYRLPPEVFQRKKMGFGVPLAAWFRGPLRDMLWDHLSGDRFLQRGFVSPNFLRQMLAEHQEERRDNNRWLWTLLVLELWFEDLESERRS